MDVPFNPETEAKLNRAAAAAGSDTGQYVQELVERYIGHDLWVREKIQMGHSQLDRGEYLSHEEVGQLLRQMIESE